MTFTEFAAKHGITLTHAPRATKKNGFGYNVTLNYAGKALTTKFFKGIHVGIPIYKASSIPNGMGGATRVIVGWKMCDYKESQRWWHDKKKISFFNSKIQPIPPQLDEVLYCLALDAQSFMNAPTWEQFASEFGCNVDSIKEKKTFRACRKQAGKLQNLFGWVMFQEFIHCTEE